MGAVATPGRKARKRETGGLKMGKSKMGKSKKVVAAVLGAGSALVYSAGYPAGPVLAAGGSSTQPAQMADAAAAMAERLYPSGAPAVVLASGVPAHYVDLIAAEALSQRILAPLLLTDGTGKLGEATQGALAWMTPPKVSTGVQPFSAAAVKPVVYLVGGRSAISAGVASRLRSEGYSVIRVWGVSALGTMQAVSRVVAPAVPSGTGSSGFPSNWTSYAGNPSHNAAVAVTAQTPGWEKAGVSWKFPEAGAVPLRAGFPDAGNLGARGAPVKMTQDLGNAVGVTAVQGVIYAESDDARLYALDARTGRELWVAGPAANALMGNPIVGDGLVFASAGDTGFPFSQVMRYTLSGGRKPLVRGLGYAGIYAFNARTGRLVWRQDFYGNAMPTPVLLGNTLYEPTGGGHLWAFDARTGRVLWKTKLGGFDSMSSANYWINPATGSAEIIVGTSDANHVVAVNASTGKILWTQGTKLGIFNTGMGDNTASVDSGSGVIVQDSVVDFNPSNKTCNLAVYAMSARTGRVLWTTKLGRGSSPPAYKAGVTMIHGGVVYVGSPVTSTFYALSEKTGRVLWSFPFHGAGPAGAGRGNAVYAYGTLWISAGPRLYALDPKTGKEIGSYVPGGRFGIVNPVIVGGTMYLDNSYDWVQAVPLTKIDPQVRVP